MKLLAIDNDQVVIGTDSRPTHSTRSHTITVPQAHDGAWPPYLRTVHSHPSLRTK
jgi:hypothetical protein